ncbi:hypothetical protein Ancab_022072 [Ancistrocladus abbreviatus]
MDYSNSTESSEWQGEDCYIPKDSSLGVSQCTWEGITQNKEDLSYMFEDTTPAKACGDFPYLENMKKVMEECKATSSQGKRRRMLQFTSEAIDHPFPSEDMSSSFLKSKERSDSIEDILNAVSQWEASFQEDMSSSEFEGLEQAENWLADCLIDTEMHFSSDSMNLSGTSDRQVDVTEVCNVQRSYVNMVEQQAVCTSQNVVFKGRKSCMRTPTKLAAAVAYPFAFVKPCSVHGDITLKDINQRICTPPPQKLEQVLVGVLNARRFHVFLVGIFCSTWQDQSRLLLSKEDLHHPERSPLLRIYNF